MTDTCEYCNGEACTEAIVAADGELSYKGGDWVKAKGIYTSL